MIEFRHDIHRHPETAFEEHRTSRKIFEALEQIPNLKVRNGLAGTGIAATLNEDKSGPCVALRADMDALPIQEISDKSYRSTYDGRMHACGHDGHISCLLGAAHVLSEHADELSGKVKFHFPSPPKSTVRAAT